MSLGRAAPLSRAVQPPSGGRVVALPRVGGLDQTREPRDCLTSSWPPHVSAHNLSSAASGRTAM